MPKNLEDNFMTSVKFSQEVEKIAIDNDDMNYIDAVLHYCETNEIEIESVPKLISKPLKEKIKFDAENLNYMKKKSRSKILTLWVTFLNQKW